MPADERPFEELLCVLDRVHRQDIRSHEQIDKRRTIEKAILKLFASTCGDTLDGLICAARASGISDERLLMLMGFGDLPKKDPLEDLIGDPKQYRGALEAEFSGKLADEHKHILDLIPKLYLLQAELETYVDGKVSSRTEALTDLRAAGVEEIQSEVNIKEELEALANWPGNVVLGQNALGVRFEQFKQSLGIEDKRRPTGFGSLS